MINQRTALLLALAVPFAVHTTSAQAPATPTHKATGTATATKHTTTATHSTAASAGPKLPPGVKPVTGPVKTGFSLKYQDYVVGTGDVAAPGKLYKVNYTGYFASDGKVFDASANHKRPLQDKDGKPVLDADGKPKMGDARTRSSSAGPPRCDSRMG